MAEVLTILVFLLAFAGLFALLKVSLGAKAASADAPRPLGSIGRLLASAVPQLKRETTQIEKELRQAGYYEPDALKRYLATRNGILLAVILATVGALCGVAGDVRATTWSVGLGVLATICFYGLPRLYLQRMAESRVDRIQQGLPDALDVITMCITAGLPLREALPKVCEEIRTGQPDLARELEIVGTQAAAGSMTQALRRFAERIDAPDVRSLAAIVGQTERLGTNAATALRDYADNVRRTRRQRSEERAGRLTVKMIFPIIFCLAPPVYIILCGPVALQLVDFINRKDNRVGKSIMPPPARLVREQAPQ